MFSEIRHGSECSQQSRAFQLAVALCAALGLAACGVTYNSPSVSKRSDALPVSVVEMDAQTVRYANASPYTPRSLPQAFFAAAATGGGVYGGGGVPSAPFVPTEQREQLEYRPLPDVAPQPYRIGVGDVLLLSTQSGGSTVEQLSGLLAATNQRQGYTVRGDGSIAIPDVGTVQVSGMTLQQAEDRVFQVLVDNQITPSFSLEVAEFNAQRVAVGGAVGSPAVVPITPSQLTLGEALIAAGGPTVRDRQFASIRIYRDGTLYQIPLETYLENPALKDRLMRAGDAVYVDTSYDLDRALEFYRARIDVISLRSSARAQALSALATEVSIRRGALEERRSNFERRTALDGVKRDYVYLTGEVNKQNRFALPYNQTSSLADVLYGEGGFDNTTGDPTEIYVLRGSSDPSKVGEIVAYHLNARNAANLILATKFEMRPDDVIFIEEQPITKWGRALQQLFPTVLGAASRAAL